MYIVVCFVFCYQVMIYIIVLDFVDPGPKVIKLFSCSTQIYLAHECLNANICWHFNIY